MAKYRIIKREYPNRYIDIDYKVQKKVSNDIDAITIGFYETLEEAKMTIEMDRTIKKEQL